MYVNPNYYGRAVILFEHTGIDYHLCHSLCSVVIPTPPLNLTTKAHGITLKSLLNKQDELHSTNASDLSGAIFGGVIGRSLALCICVIVVYLKSKRKKSGQIGMKKLFFRIQILKT